MSMLVFHALALLSLIVRNGSTMIVNKKIDLSQNNDDSSVVVAAVAVVDAGPKKIDIRERRRHMRHFSAVNMQITLTLQ